MEYEWGSSDPHIVVTICLCIWDVKSTLIHSNTQNSYSHSWKEYSCSFPPEITPLFLLTTLYTSSLVDCVWNVMAHAQKPDFVFLRNGRVHLNRQGCQFSRLLAAEVCASAVVMLDTPCSEVVCRVPATHSIRHFPLHFPSRASPCAITFQLDSAARLPDCQRQSPNSVICC